jgi:hypothetical protein
MQFASTKYLKLIILLILAIATKNASAQKILLDANNLEANQVYLTFEKIDNKKVVKVIMDSTVKKANEPTFAKIKSTRFKNGTIEVKVLSRLLKNASPGARGFIGIAFKIDDKNSRFECIYIRPTNGRADDQVRRNHSIQYYAYPDFKFDRLRKEAPETFESYADMGLNEWITMRIEVKGKEATLFLNNSKYPVFVVKDLKFGENTEGGIGLWVDGGTEGFFKDLKVTHKLDTVKAQSNLQIVEPSTGIRLRVINKEFPKLQILLPKQSNSERGIEVEFPEHVTVINKKTLLAEHLYLESRGNLNKMTSPSWKIEGSAFTYETVLNDSVKMKATAQLDAYGVRYSYTFMNNSSVSYQTIQAVTCIKLYSAFSDTLLERTYVHHSDGFDLLASETPERLTMPLNKWLPCRYLVSCDWPVAAKRKEKDEDSITRYNKSRKADIPLMVTLSHDKKWVAATYTNKTGNLWTNPERSCHHVDPSAALNRNETKTLILKTYLYAGSLEQVLNFIAKGK